MVSRSGELLVVSNDGLTETAVLDRIADRARELGADACLVIPCPVGDDPAAAERTYTSRGRVASEYLAERGIYAEWILASYDPVAAVAEAMLVSDAREIMVVTRPAGQSEWLRSRVVERTRRFGLPVVHETAEIPPEARWERELPYAGAATA